MYTYVYIHIYIYIYIHISMYITRPVWASNGPVPNPPSWNGRIPNRPLEVVPHFIRDFRLQGMFLYKTLPFLTDLSNFTRDFLSKGKPDSKFTTACF